MKSAKTTSELCPLLQSSKQVSHFLCSTASWMTSLERKEFSPTRTCSSAATRPGTATAAHLRPSTSRPRRGRRGSRTSTTAARPRPACQSFCPGWRVATTRSSATRTPCSRTRFTASPSSSCRPSSSSSFCSSLPS